LGSAPPLSGAIHWRIGEKHLGVGEFFVYPYAFLVICLNSAASKFFFFDVLQDSTFFSFVV
jgi:hypothetical protein